MPLPHRPKRFMKKTFSKWCLPVKDRKCGGGPGAAFSSSAHIGEHHVVFLRAIFKLSFQISYTGNAHTTQMRNVNVRERKTRERVPVNASGQGVLPGYSLTFHLLHLMLTAQAKSPQHSANKIPASVLGSPSRGDQPASLYLAPAVISFPANFFIP